VFNNLLRRKHHKIRRLATDLDPERPYVAGVLTRFDEEYASAMAMGLAMDPNFRPAPVPEGAPVRERAWLAAQTMAVGIAIGAMGSQGKLSVLLDRGEAIGQGAIGLTYAMFIYSLLLSYLEADGVEVGSEPLRFAEMFPVLDDARRAEVQKKALGLFE
jgi:hypothetical protein